MHFPPVKRGMRRFREDGFLSFIYHTLNYSDIFLPLWNTVTSRYTYGTNVFEYDWDLLIILDTCRVDALNSCAESISWSDEIGQIQSVGSMSAEWMLKTFTESYKDSIAETAFVSGNIWSHRIFNERFHQHTDHEYDMIHTGVPKWEPVSSDAFAHYETVYPFTNQDIRLHPEAEHIPHVQTDRAIAVGRQKEFERLVVHYTLPHLNHIANALDWTAGETTQQELMSGELAVTRELRPEEKSFEPTRRGEVTSEAIRNSFTANLRFALEYIEILIQNVDADRAVISADHGEGFGENGTWSHPFGYPFSPIRTVPWAKITATDERTYESQFGKLDRAPTEEELREHLEAMGYYPS